MAQYTDPFIKTHEDIEGMVAAVDRCTSSSEEIDMWPWVKHPREGEPKWKGEETWSVENGPYMFIVSRDAYLGSFEVFTLLRIHLEAEEIKHLGWAESSKQGRIYIEQTQQDNK